MTFKQPVEVGNLLQLDSCVLFTSSNTGVQPPNVMHVEVVALITVPEHRSCKVSNTFYFSFQVPPHVTLPRIVPDSLEQAHRMIAR